MSDEIFDDLDGALEPMTKRPPHIRQRETQEQLDLIAKDARDAWLLGAVETMRRAM